MSAATLIFQGLKDFSFFSVLCVNSKSLLFCQARQGVKHPQVPPRFLKMTSSLKSDNITVLLICRLRFRNVKQLVLGFKVGNIILLTHLLPNRKKRKEKKNCIFSSKAARWPFMFSVSCFESFCYLSAVVKIVTTVIGKWSLVSPMDASNKYYCT